MPRAVCVLLAVIFVSIGQATFANPLAILLAILIVAGMFDAFVARRKLARLCGDIESVEAVVVKLMARIPVLRASRRRTRAMVRRRALMN